MRGDDARRAVSVGLVAAGVVATAALLAGPWVALLVVVALGVTTWALLSR